MKIDLSLLAHLVDQSETNRPRRDSGVRFSRGQPGLGCEKSISLGLQVKAAIPSSRGQAEQFSTQDRDQTRCSHGARSRSGASLHSSFPFWSFWPKQGMPLNRMYVWLSRASHHSETVAGHVPEGFSAYIKAIDYWKNGASLELTRDGLNFGRESLVGALQLAEVVTTQDGWRGNRSLHNMALEIRDHCRAWFWIPLLRSRANPVDLEFFDSWPGSLLIAIHLKKPARPESKL